MKILLFDDDNDFAAALQESLSDHHKIVSTGNYYQAKEYLIKDNFDLIVSEIKDSDDNNIGINFLKIIKASGIEPPIIMLASKSDISLAVESVKLGASDFIEKSADYETTIINIENAIEKLVEAGPKNRKKDQGIKTDCKFLFVDDNQEFTKSIKFYCGKKYYIETINDFLGARGVIDENKYDCIFLDINDEVNNDDKAGVKLLKDIIAKDPDIPVIMLSGWTNTALAVECLKLGAYDFLEKSLKIYETIEKVEGILKKITKGKERDNKDLEETFAGPSYRVIDIIGECEKVRKIKQEIIDVADHHDVPVLIYGETGTGKEMVASAIHIASSRRDHSFVELDCSAIPDSIFESELFGYTKGAFTGAVGSRKGKMEQAHNGTLFLDEIENLSLDQQSKLLKVLEEKKINPLGSNAPKIVDFRLILATNINLQKLVEEGKFREDLFFRIHVYQVELPPLRERGEEDIYLIIDHYINDRSVTIEKDALELLKKYTWPGNARELKNLLKKFEIIARTNDNIITFEIVKEGFRKYKDRDQIKDTLGDLVDYYGGNVPAMLKDFEDAAVLGMFKEYTGNISKIAQKVYKESTEDTKNHREKVRKVLERNTHVLDEYDDIDD